jgi:hypothetical protein
MATAMRFRAVMALVVGLGLLAVRPGAQTLRATSVNDYAVPGGLPPVVVKGSCESSRAAWFREDAAQCTVGGSRYDPCFRTAADNQWLCVKDPRKPESSVLISAAAFVRSDAGQGATHRVWFFVLADDSTCAPLLVLGRNVEGLTELYTCRFGSDGEADAVLGDFDTSQPVWTIRKVLINKKTDPQTIKSLAIAAVKAVWQ